MTKSKIKTYFSINFLHLRSNVAMVLVFAAVSLSIAADSLEKPIEILPQITESKKGPSWDDSWSKAISLEILSNKEHPLLTTEIHPEDIKKFSCSNFNQLTPEQKTAFWIVFFSALTKAESSFNPKARSKAPKGGHGNYGLLQLSKRTARDFCQLDDQIEEYYVPEKNLICGVKLLSYQIQGAPNKNGKLVRAKAKGRIFTSPIFFWGPLRAKDFKGRKRLMTWFEKQKDQLPFCS